jgi:hypothetical protein
VRRLEKIAVLSFEATSMAPVETGAGVDEFGKGGDLDVETPKSRELWPFAVAPDQPL